MALALLGLKKIPEAQQALEVGLKFDPNNEEIRGIIIIRLLVQFLIS